MYIGKAINIQNRVKSHFRQNNTDPRNMSMLSKVKKIETISVDSDIEALILESNLIKKFKPAFNSQLKDDKDYLYIKITDDQYAKVKAARKRDLKGAKIYFGPYPSATKVRTTIKILRKIFRFGNCSPNQKRPCLYYHLGLCPGVCVGLTTPEQYRKNIRKLVMFLRGETSKVTRSLMQEVQSAIRNLEFEKAGQIQKQLDSLNYVTKVYRDIEDLGLGLQETRERELKELAAVLNLSEDPERIECYDISNIRGKEATGSMVVFSQAIADHNSYRRFRIKSVKGINDTAMIAEVLTRRFKNDWQRPDLIVIDGGKGQLNSAIGVLGKNHLDIPVISLAKRLEEIYQVGKPHPLRLDRSNPALKLVQRMRDESHRFAITYHRNLRNRDFLTVVSGFDNLKANEKKVS